MSRSRYGARVAAGLCGDCGGPRAATHPVCEACRADRAAVRARRRAKARAWGITLDTARHQARLAAGRCIHCNQPNDRPRAQACARCAARIASRAQARRLGAVLKEYTQHKLDVARVTKWQPETPPTATHIAGYVPPKGSIALHFVGRVVASHYGQSA